MFTVKPKWKARLIQIFGAEEAHARVVDIPDAPAFKHPAPPKMKAPRKRKFGRRKKVAAKPKKRRAPRGGVRGVNRLLPALKKL